MAHRFHSGDLLADRRYAYAEGCLAEGDLAGAADLCEQTLERAPRFAPAWFLLGRAREAQAASSGDPGGYDAARRAYANALDLDPDDTLGSRLHLAGIGGTGDLSAISPAYVRALFDGYAPRFERHLVGTLGYRGPALVMAALDAAAGAAARFREGLDLGCGTGLMGAALGGRVGRLTGIDLSPGMLDIARRGHAYARLVEAELLAFLTGEPAACVDLVVAADVFIYCGDLGPILDEVARVSRPGGHAVFTVQSHDGDGVILGRDARYAHGDAHLRAASRGLDLLTLQPAAVRRENGVDVPGRVVVARCR